MTYIQQAIETTIVGVIGGAGLITNLLAILIACLTFRHWKVLHLMMILPVIMDIGAILVYVPLYMTALLSNFNAFPDGVCTIMTLVFYCFMASSSCVTFILAFSRMVLSRSQKIYKRWFTIERSLIYIFVSCLICITALIIPLLIFTTMTQSFHYVVSTQCLQSGHQLTSFMGVVWPFIFFIPNHGTAFCYLKMFLNIQRVRDSGERFKHDLFQGRITMCMAFVIVAICWVPFLMIHLYDPNQTRLSPLAHRVTLYLLLLNPLFNSLSYTFRAGDFRAGMFHLLKTKNNRSITDTMYNADVQDFDEEFRERANEYSMFTLPVKIPRSRPHSKKNTNAEFKATVQRVCSVKSKGKKQSQPNKDITTACTETKHAAVSSREEVINSSKIRQTTINPMSSITNQETANSTIHRQEEHIDSKLPRQAASIDSKLPRQAACIDSKLPRQAACIDSKLPRQAACIDSKLPRQAACIDAKLPRQATCIDFDSPSDVTKF